MSALSMTALAALVFLGSMASAQEPKAKPSLPNLAARLHSVRFAIADGRIQAMATEPGVERETSSDAGAIRRDRLILNTTGEQGPAIQYQLTAGSEQLNVDVVGGNQFTISRRAIDNSKQVAIEFHQPIDGPLTLSIKDQMSAREYKGATIWHLFLAAPDLCCEHLVPLLEMLRSDWRLAETAQSIEERMIRAAGETKPEKVRNWDALVAQLASDRFADRQRAERELRAAGLAAIPYLRSLDHRQLEFEQWSRIQQVVDASDTDDEDRSETTAVRLMADRQAWLALLDRADESTRRTAVAELSRLLGETIAFDAAAPEPVRKEQLEALRKRLNRE
jgi:hypothetical protein